MADEDRRAQVSNEWSVWRTYRHHVRVVIEGTENRCRTTYAREVKKLREGSVILRRPDGGTEARRIRDYVYWNGELESDG